MGLVPFTKNRGNSEKARRISPGFFFAARFVRRLPELLLTWVPGMAREKQNQKDAAAELSQRITEALLRERVVPRFVDSYVIENGRHALQVHASLYRDLLALLQREALLAMSVRALEIGRAHV